MKYPEKAMRAAALGLLLCFALETEHIPQLRDKTIVRGAELSRQGDGYAVTLICHQVMPAANAADAKEQMQAVRGEGETLLRACMQAEQQLPGRVTYPLCDVLVLSGPEILQELEAVSQLVRANQKGSPAAKLLYTAAPYTDPTDEALSRRYASLRQAARKAPRLYQAGKAVLLVPQIDGQTTQVTGAAALEKYRVTGTLSRQAARLYTCVTRGHGRMEVQLDVARVPLYLMVSREVRGGSLFRRVDLFPVEDTLETGLARRCKPEVLAQIQQLWREVEPLDRRNLAGGQGDACFFARKNSREPTNRPNALPAQTKFVWMDKSH